jgi:uncharacterized protein YbjT (DUF2867 family)
VHAGGESELARGFALTAERAGIGRIVYLGRLLGPGADEDERFSSQREVENALASGNVPITVVRTSMIIGSGSASFEILRYLVERMPIMIIPQFIQLAGPQ